MQMRKRQQKANHKPALIKKNSLLALRRLKPLSLNWGFERGTPIDRYYIEKFLSRHAADIRGRVLEIQNNYYTFRFGRKRVTESDVLHVEQGNPKATIIADLTRADCIPSNSFDCIILTQTLYLIYDTQAAIRTLHRILKPKGVLLVTFPGINKISRYDINRWGEYWRFTSLSAKKLFECSFSRNRIEVQTHGNVFVASAFLYGLAAEELKRAELNYRDADYEVLITVRATKE